MGQPVAAWPISSQFDIIRDYNSTTGEETNKIIESTERPWNEREFIRVDWSQNLVTDSDVVGLGHQLLLRGRRQGRAGQLLGVGPDQAGRVPHGARRRRPTPTSSTRAKPTTSTSPTSGSSPRPRRR